MKKYFIFLILLVSCTNTTEDSSAIKTVQSKIPNRPVVPEVSLKPTAPLIQAAYITRIGVIDCFKKGLKNLAHDSVFCETTAASYVDNHLLIASQVAIPGNNNSSLLTFDYNENMPYPTERYYLTDEIFNKIYDYQDISVTPTGDYAIATTSFGRIIESNSEWDSYNSLLFWPIDNPKAVKVVMPTTSQGITSSVGLRRKIAMALGSDEFPDGVPYFKIEGIALIPGNKLLLGISEIGENDENFTQVVQIVSVSYDIVDEELQLADDYELIYNFDPQRMPCVRYPNWLSGLEYDKYRNTLLFLTSFETFGLGKRVGGYLWSLTLQDLYNNRPATLIYETETKTRPLTFSRKPGDITLLSAQNAFVIYNDERSKGRNIVDNSDIYGHREPHQAIYSTIKLK